MLPRERIECILDRRTPDYIPIFPKISHAACRVIQGMSMHDYMTSPLNMARAIMAAAELYGWDGVGIMTDIANEGMAIGSRFKIPEEGVSQLIEHYLGSLEEYDKVRVGNPLETEPTKTIIEAVRIVKEEIGERIYVTAWCNGPLNVASQLISAQELLIGMMTTPDLVHELSERCLNYTMNYVDYLSAAGVDSLSFGHAMASCSMISPGQYEEFALPYEKKLVASMHRNNIRANTHICGNIEAIAPLITQNGCDIIDFDHMCNVEPLLEKTTQVLRGNIDPMVLAGGTAEEVYRLTSALVKKVKDRGRFILGSGCEISVETPAENLHAFVKAGRDFGEY